MRTAIFAAAGLGALTCRRRTLLIAIMSRARRSLSCALHFVPAPGSITPGKIVMSAHRGFGLADATVSTSTTSKPPPRQAHRLAGFRRHPAERAVPARAGYGGIRSGRAVPSASCLPRIEAPVRAERVYRDTVDLWAPPRSQSFPRQLMVVDLPTPGEPGEAAADAVPCRIPAGASQAAPRPDDRHPLSISVIASPIRAVTRAEVSGKAAMSTRHCSAGSCLGLQRRRAAAGAHRAPPRKWTKIHRSTAPLWALPQGLAAARRTQTSFPQSPVGSPPREIGSPRQPSHRSP